MNDKIKNKAAKIKLLILDVDGVLTNGKIYVTADGSQCKDFSSSDGIGMKLLLKAGIEIAIISGGKSSCVDHRMNFLGIKYVYQEQSNKMLAFNELKQILSLENDQIAYVGDDLPDLKPILTASLGIAVANASDVVKQQADLITKKCGGSGAVREVCELILESQIGLNKIHQQFLLNE